VVEQARPLVGSGWRVWPVVVPLAALFASVGLFGVYRYLDNYWLYRGFAPPHDPAYVRIRGSEQVIRVSSPALGGRTQEVFVYLPPGYGNSPARRYPVFYLLHGSPGRPLAFLLTVQLGVLLDEQVALGRMQPLILVMPNGSTGTFTDKEWANGVHANEAWESFVSKDVVHMIDARYRTIPTGKGRAIGGLSEGGYGALNLALHHPGEFRVVESWSGYQRARAIASIFGGDRRRLAYNSPSAYLPRVARQLRARHVFVWFYSSGEDSFLRENLAFARELSRHRVRHAFFVEHGRHTWVIWRANARTALLVAAARVAHG
jgi:enterochelin esterase-like enzyme